MKFFSSAPNLGSTDSKLTFGVVMWILRLVLAVTVVFVFVPFSPSMPTGLNPLDPSWVFGLNVAAAQHWIFGSDLLFTYGPYASIFTRTFHPFTDPFALYGSLYLAVAYTAALLFVTRKSTALLLLINIAAFSFFKQYTDTLLSSYALIMGIYCYQLIYLPIRSERSAVGMIFLTFALFTPFGLYPLVKGSIYILYFAVAILSSGVFLYLRKWYLALSISLAIISSLILFWLIAGQPLTGLLGYFTSLGMIIAGYSDAMSVTGNQSEILAYLFSSFFLIFVLLRKKGVNIEAIYLGVVFALYLFISFKGGFVRHDGHAVYGVSALYFAAIIFFVVFPSFQAVIALLLACLTFIYIDSHYDNSLYLRRFAPVSETYQWGIYGVKNRLFNEAQLLEDYKKSVEVIKNEARFPSLIGTVDTYPVDQSRVIASGYNWAPRPVFQSYAAYNPQLAKINNTHLLSSKAPDNIVFRILTIDNRYPSLDDGLSWPTILNNYRLAGTQGEFIFLSKDQGRNIQPTICSLSSNAFEFGQSISVPDSKGLIFVEIDVKPTLLGRLINILFKTSELHIKVFLENGESKDYRMIPGMAKSGFILSPLVENTKNFETLISKQNLDKLSQVKTFTIAPVAQFWQWNQKFSIEFKDVQFPNKPEISCAK